MDKFIDWLEKVLEWLSGLILVLLLITVWLQVFTRYILNNSLPWTEEAARFMMIWGVMLGANIAFLKGYFISITFFTSKLPGTVRRVLRLVRYLIILGFNGILVYYGILYSKMGLRMTSPAIGIKYYWVYISIPIGISILFLFTLLKTVRDKSTKQKKPRDKFRNQLQ